jgi:CBS domain-containing protein
MASVDPIAWLRATPPFRELPPERFARAAEAVDVVYHPAGTWLVRTGGRPLEHLFVIRKGAVRLERDGQTLQLIEEGECFGYTSLITGQANLDVQVEEDLVAYRVPAAEFRGLLEDPQFASHFAAGLGERLKSALAQPPEATFRTDLSLEVQQVAREPAIWVEADATVGEAAWRMRAERASCVLVRGDPPGIVTDRDFRNRVLAEGLGPAARVADVATASPRTVRAGTRIYEAWAALLDAGVHHLPVVRGEEIVAVLTSTDLLRCSAQGPMAVLRRVERLHGRASLPGYAATVTEMVTALLAGGLDATVIAGFVARLNDALLERIVRMAEADLGEAPCHWAWLALGSEGRMEQTLLTDQDNALVWEREGEEVRAWFVGFAERVNADLEAAGFPRCAGGYMARSWNGSLDAWVERFEEWVDAPSPEALLHGAIFFDFRRVAGTLDLAPLEAVLADAVKKPVFVRFLARAALDFKPPPLLLITLRGRSTVDLKLHGIAPVALLARCYGLEQGGAPRSTLARLEAAAKAGTLPEDVYASVVDAYRFLVGLRLRRQLDRIAKGEAPGSTVALAELTAVERGHVKDALRVVKTFQEAGALHFRTSF